MAELNSKGFIQSPIHLNLNIYAAVAIETSGPLVRYNDLIKLCIIPLNNFYEPINGVIPFLATFKPINEEHPDISKEDYARTLATGIHPNYAHDVMQYWFDHLPITKGKRLCPISHNWAYESAFIKELIGPTLFSEVFFEGSRDITSIACYINDACAMTMEQIPFPKYSLQVYCNRLNVIIDEPHYDALNRCRATIEVYKRILKRVYKGVPL